MARKRSFLGRLQRDLYLASRTAGDIEAAKNGRYVQRRIRRVERRKLLGLLRKAGL